MITKTKKKQTLSKFFICHYDDYHDIRSTTHKYIELGCFPVKNSNYGYNRYFGLFFRGKKPSFTRVFNSIKRKIEFDTKDDKVVHYFTGEEIGIDPKTLKEEIVESMKNDPSGPDSE